MTNTQPENHSTNETPTTVQPHPIPIAISASQLISRTQTLILLRYLVDIKQRPAEPFHQAVRELGLTDHFAAARQARSDNPEQRPPIDHDAITAVLIHTYFNTELPDRPPEATAPIITQPPNLPHPHTCYRFSTTYQPISKPPLSPGGLIRVPSTKPNLVTDAKRASSQSSDCEVRERSS